MRAQTSLPALGIALLLLVSTSVFAISVAQEERRQAQADTLERESAMGLADALVAPESGVAVRGNVLDRAPLAGLTATELESHYGLESQAGVRLRLDGTTILERGTIGEGSTVQRIVLVEDRSSRTILPAVTASRNLTLPRRTPNVSIRLQPRNTTIDTVRVNGRVALADPSGLSGTARVPVSRYETVTLRFAGSGNLSQGDVRVTYYPARTRKATVSVTVQRWGYPDG